MPLTAPPSAPPAAPAAPGDAPARTNPTTFRALADAFVVWQVGFRTSIASLRTWLADYITWAGTHVTEMNALQADVSAKSSQVTTDAAQVAADASTVQGIAAAFGDVDAAVFLADASADRAAGSATQSAGSATAADVARVAAEAARDSVNTTGKVFTAAEGTAAGIAATSNGQQFAVLDASLNFWTIYRNNSGVASAALSQGYTKAYQDQLGDLTATRYFQGKRVMFSRADSATSAGDVITEDGQHYAKYAIRGGSGLAVSQAADSFFEIALDAPARIETQSFVFDTAAVAGDAQLFRTNKSSGTRQQATSAGNNLFPAVSSDGAKVIYSTDRNGSWEGYYQILSGAKFGGAIEHPAVPRRTIMALGDSLTAAGYAATVASTLGTTLLVTSSAAATGIGSQTSAQIAARYGASALTCSITGNAISSGANTLTAISVQMLSRVSDGAGTVRTLRASIQGITGVLTSTQSTTLVAGALTFSGQWYTYTFTPDGGQALPVSALAGSALVIDPEDRQDSVLLVWMGRNDVGTGAGWQTTVKAKIAEVFAAYKPLVRRICLLSITNTTGEPSGSTNYNEIVALNAELASLYPDSFVDVRTAYNSGTGTDIPAAANTSDGLHYTDPVGKLVIATAVSNFITSKGWFA